MSKINFDILSGIRVKMSSHKTAIFLGFHIPFLSVHSFLVAIWMKQQGLFTKRM